MADYDVIIIGAGHNGLVAAGYLAKAGRRVLVLERRDRVGGAAVTEEVFPAAIDGALANEVQRLGEATHRALGLRDFSRVDFRLDAEGRPHCIEANTLPGMTATSLLPKSAAASGLSFGDLCDRLLELALRRVGHGNKVHG